MSEGKADGAGPEWFAPKRHGYGAGLPIVWQGWALLLGFLVLAIALVPLAVRSLVLYLGVMLPATALFMWVVKKTTRGGWRWRNGERD